MIDSNHLRDLRLAGLYRGAVGEDSFMQKKLNPVCKQTLKSNVTSVQLIALLKCRAAKTPKMEPKQMIGSVTIYKAA
jgi:hypothetical protein